MNPIAEEIASYFGVSESSEDDLEHYGVKRRSGRYPWGSGEDPYQHSGDFISRVSELKKQGLSEKEIVESLGFESTTQYRTAYQRATHERRRLMVDKARSLAEDGLGATEIGRQLGASESTVRSWLNEKSAENMNRAEKAADILRKEIEKKSYIDIGDGVERELGISRQKMNEALDILQDEGYNVLGVTVPQVSDSKKRTTVKVVAEPGDYKEQQRELYQDPAKIQSFGDYHSVDGGVSWSKREYPASISSDRVKINYGDEGGINKDGVIEIRRGVADLDLGNSHYAQVRIMVDGTHYLKGMAMYSDDIPDGVDIVFNTNKKSGTPKLDVLKEIKDDPDNPFGAYIKAGGQSWYTGSDGKRHLSAINKLKEEGDWDTMSRNLSSQFLSKQPMQLINKQLSLTYADYESEFDEIMSCTNPTIRKKLLYDFANECDSAAVHLKAAALPRQSTRVILPVTALKETEIYAPYLKDGEHVALVRYPHGGTFEIPELVVNNKNASAKKILGNAIDAVGINAKVAERLSGADFDGDTVVVIPTNSRVKIKSSPALKDLEGFDPKTQYAYHEGMSVMKKSMTGKQMGMVSNLITDMTLQGAPEADIARAVKHSMVVIDAAKHKLDYKQSEKDNGIEELRKKYQVKYDSEGNPIGYGGASTLLSRRKQTVEVPERRGAPMIDKETGKVSYKESGRTYVDKDGKVVQAKSKTSLITSVDDVRTLSSGTLQENAYADYANKVLALANKARKTWANSKGVTYDAGAKKTYAKEVKELDEALDRAARNRPRERRAQALANSVIKAKVQANPELSDKANKKDLEKIKRLALEEARNSVGASSKSNRINITDRQWEAIQAGAVSDTKLTQILRYTDPDAIRQRAMPKTTTTLSSAKQNKIKSMQSSGYTIAQIAESLGVSTSTVSKYLK